MPGSWPLHQLHAIVEADDLKVAPWREDGLTAGTPTWIWCVSVGPALYVRAYHGRRSRWFQAALRQRAGQIVAVGMRWDVHFDPLEDSADPALQARIDAAYRAKYARSSYLSSMLSERPRSATVRIEPTT